MPVIPGGGSSSLPGSVGNLIDRVFRWAQQRGSVDTITSAISAHSQGDSVTFTVADVTKWGTPSVIEIGAELFYVTNVTQGTSTVTAIGGWLDTDTSTALVNTVARLSPRFYRRDAFDAIVDAVRKMAPPLWKMTSTDITYDAGLSGYDLNAAAEDVYAIYNERDSTRKRWKEVYDFDVMPKANTASFASGVALIINENRILPGPLRVVYKSKFTDPASESDDLEADIGLEPYMFDIPVWYAVSTLVPPDEVMRGQVNAAVSSQRAEQVPPRSNVTTAEYFRARYEDSLADAVSRLRQKYPAKVRFRWR
jgi:hypothetical protein